MNIRGMITAVVVATVFSLILLQAGEMKSQSLPPLLIDIHDSAATGGFFFLAPYRSFGPFVYSHPQMILDRYGNVIFYRLLPGFNISNTTTEDFKLQPDGRMSYFSRYLNHFCIMDSTFTVVDSISTVNGYAVDVHDLQILPNGNYLLMGQESRYMNLSSYHWFGPFHTNPGSTSAEVIGIVIQEFDPATNLVWEWKGHDHYDFSDVDSVWLSSPSKVDWTHANAVALDHDGNIMVSLRHFNEVTKIDRQTGQILWRFGGKRNQFTFLNDPLRFNGQHDIRRIANGHVTLFDNGRYHPSPVARALEYALDETAKTATLVWEYIPDSAMYSNSVGNHQVLEGGDHLIDFGNCPGDNPWLVMVKQDHSKIIEINCPMDYTSYRAFNYPDLPWAFPRPYVDCIMADDTAYLVGEPGHPTYFWSTGALTPSIPVTDTGTYWYFVPYGDGYISSERIRIWDPQQPCAYLGTSPAAKPTQTSIICYPNPVERFLHVEFNLTVHSTVDWSICNPQGRVYHSQPQRAYPEGRNHLRIDLSDYPAGIYVFRLRTGEIQEARKVVKIG